MCIIGKIQALKSPPVNDTFHNIFRKIQSGEVQETAMPLQFLNTLAMAYKP